MNKQWAFYTIEMPPIHIFDQNNNQLLVRSFDRNTMAVDPFVGVQECGALGLIMTPTLRVVERSDGSGFLEATKVSEKSVVIPHGALSRFQEESRRERKEVEGYQNGNGGRPRSQQGGPPKPRSFWDR